MSDAKQKKVSIPADEMDLAKAQAKKEGWGDNVTGYIRWLIRTKCSKAEKAGIGT